MTADEMCAIVMYIQALSETSINVPASVLKAAEALEALYEATLEQEEQDE